MTITLRSAKAAFLQAGWRLDHISRTNGQIRSYYFAHFEGEYPRVKPVRVRVSDHALGETVYGQPQGQHLDLDLVIGDFDAAAVPTDFIAIANNRDAYHDYGVTGIAPSTDPEDWAEALEAQE